MESTLKKLRRIIIDKYPDSRLETASDAEVASFSDDYPNPPSHLIEFLREIGFGRIGNSRYMIHFPMTPNEVYDAETASSLGNVLIVGDNFGGHCDGYDVDNGWAFGTIGADCEFSELEEFKTITDWLLFMLDDE